MLFIKNWNAAKISNINKIQTVQTKILCDIINALPYISNEIIHKHLNIILQIVFFLVNKKKTEYQSRDHGGVNGSKLLNRFDGFSNPKVTG